MTTTEDTSLLDKYCRDLASRPGPVDPSIDARFASEARRAFRDLADRRSLVFVGPPGVGKTVLVHHLADLVRRGACPSELEKTRWLEASCAALMAGTRYVGEWETKVFQLIRALGARSVLHLSDIWNLVGSGSYHGSAKDLFDSFKGAIDARDVVLVGEMTEERLAALTVREPTFPQLFAVHRVAEPPEAVVRQVLNAHARQIARRSKVEIGVQTVERVLALTRRFVPYEVWPGKAIRLLERVIADATTVEARLTVDPDTVWQVFAAHTGLPLWILDDGQPMDLEKTRAFFSDRVLGQDEAVSKVVDTITVYKARLNDPTKPIGVLFFVGPTGVGKTELAKALATFLFGSPDRMIRLDMSEFVTFDSVERLLGKKAPASDSDPGDQGLLTGSVRKAPFSVVLLDEVEKAHPFVHDLMLQVFSDGRLTDARGETTDFRNTIIVLTANLGARATTEIGFKGKGAGRFGDLAGRVHREIEAHFRPEFVNRLDHIVVFRPLDEDTCRRIARRELSRLCLLEGLTELKPILEAEEDAVSLLVRRGFDPKFGARPLKRAVRELVTTPLARLLVTRNAATGQVIRLLARGDQMILDLEPPDDPTPAGTGDLRMEIDSPGLSRPARLTVRDVSASIEGILRRIEKAEVAFDVESAREEIRRLEAIRSGPDFWADPSESARLLHRLHRLEGEAKRFTELRDLARVVFEATELTVRERDTALLRDIAREYGRLLERLERLELECELFDAAARHDVFLQVSAAGMGGKDRRWVEELAAMYEGWCRSKGYHWTVLYHPPPGQKEMEIAVKALVEGTYANGYLAGEEGLHRLTRRPAGSDAREAETVAARVTVNALPGPEDQQPSCRQPALESLPGRRKPGGGSCHRIHVPGEEVSLVLCNDLSELENRELGGRILRALRAGSGVPSSGSDEAHRLVRTYDAAANMIVKDKRTGHVSRHLRKVFAGQIDDFLVAFLKARKEGRTGPDRPRHPDES